MNKDVGEIGTKCLAFLGVFAFLSAAAMGGLYFSNKFSGPYARNERTEKENLTAFSASENFIWDWPEVARATARMIFEKYGRPTYSTPQALVWLKNGPWQETEVFRIPRTRHLVKTEKDFLKQTVRYQVPFDMVADLKRFENRIEFNTTTGELSSQSESEELNYLTLNLADDIVTQRRSVEDARAFFNKTQEMAKSGKDSPYLNSLLFKISADKLVY